MQEPRNLSWTHHNKARKFPLMFDCVPTSTDTFFTIPDDLFVALYLSCRTGEGHHDPGRFSIGSLTYYQTGFVLTIHYENTVVAETTIDLSSGKHPEVIPLRGVNPMVLSGFLVLGGLEGLTRQPAGEWLFDPEATTLDPFCVRYVPKELSELYVRSQGRLMGPFHGPVTFEEGENIRLTVYGDKTMNCLDQTLEGQSTQVFIGATDPEANVPCVRAINTVLPDNQGQITFKGTGCLKITAEGPHTLVFTDKCAEPCCSCTELAPIEQAINEITDSISQLTSRMATLEAQNTFMQHTFGIAAHN